MNTKERNRTPASLKRLTIPIYGLACGGGGSLSLEQDLEKLNGVSKIYVNPATQEAYIDVTEGFSIEETLETIKAQGLKHGNIRFN